MQAHVASISYHVPRRRASSSKLRIRSLVPSSLFLQIDHRRASASAVVVLRGERVRFPEQPCELAEQRGPACLSERRRDRARVEDVAYHVFTLGSFSESVLCVSSRVRPTAATLRSFRTNGEI